MSGVFQLVGGPADPIAVKLDSTDATTVAESVEGQGRKSIAWLRCTEIAGDTPTLAIAIKKDDDTVVYLRAATAMTANESILFEEGWVLREGWKLQVTAGAADKIDVTGLALLGNT